MNRTVSPSLPQLRALVAVAGTLNFRDAAALLRISQPAVSAAIAGLESTLGVRLVERTTRRVHLTATGEAVAERARQAVQAVEEVTRTAHAGRRPLAGPLRLGIIPTVAPYVLPALMAGLRRDLPRCAPDVLEDQTARLEEELDRGRIDVAVMALPPGPASLTAWPLYREDFLLAVPADHELAGRQDLPHEVLTSLELLLLSDGHCLRDQVLDVCRGVGASSTHPARTASLATLTSLVAAGMGATLLPASATGRDAGAGVGVGVGLATMAPPVPGRTVGLAHRAGSTRSLEYEVLTLVLRDAVRAAGIGVHIVDQTPSGSVQARNTLQDIASGPGGSGERPAASDGNRSGDGPLEYSAGRPAATSAGPVPAPPPAPGR